MWKIYEYLIHLYNLIKKYPKRSLFILIIFIIYTILHEFIHYFTLLYYKYPSKINLLSFIPTVSFDPNIPLSIKFIASLTPYFFSLFLIIILFNFRNNIYIKIISTMAFLDFSYNLFSLSFALLFSIPNDFILSYYLGKLWFIIILWMIVLVFWILTVSNKYHKLLKFH